MHGIVGTKQSLQQEFGLTDQQYQTVSNLMTDGPNKWNPALLAYLGNVNNRASRLESQMANYKGVIETIHQWDVARFISEWVKRS